MLLFVVSAFLLLKDGECHLYLKTVNSLAADSSSSSSSESVAESASSEGTRILSCRSPTSILLIRSAHYLTPSSSFSADHVHDYYPLPSAAHPSLFRHGERMTSRDVMKVYRHCRGPTRLRRCDVTGAGVGEEFEISYYCLEGPLLNPCSNTTSEVLNSTSMFFNYSRHTTDCDVTCHCTVTSVTSGMQTLYIRALNLFEEPEEGKSDGVGSDQTFPDAEGCNHTMEQPGPRVLIKSSGKQWEVERRAVPVQWQLRENGSFKLDLDFLRMHGRSFGRLWIGLEGRDMLVSCGAIIHPGSSLPVSAPPGKNVDTGDSGGTGHPDPLTYIAAGSTLVVLTVIIIVIVAAAKYKRRRSYRRKKRTIGNWPHPDDNPDPAYNNNGCHNLYRLDGEYCTINDVTSSSSPPGQPETRCRSREDDNRPINAETTFSEDGGHAVETVTRARIGDSEYGTLHHGPSAQGPISPRVDGVIYDHTSTFGLNGDSEYHCLSRGVSVEPRVIDNVYDTTASVQSS